MRPAQPAAVAALTALLLTGCPSARTLHLSPVADAATATPGPSTSATPSTSASATPTQSPTPDPGPAPGGPLPPAGAWGLPADPAAAARNAGLPMFPDREPEVHYHAHLDVVVDGKPVQVPEHIGIDEGRGTTSALHSHDTTGVIHVESDEDLPYTLGQFFTEWGQPLTATQIGPVTLDAKEVCRTFVNGREIRHPATHVLRPHEEIMVWIGPATEAPQVPSGYWFAPGL